MRSLIGTLTGRGRPRAALPRPSGTAGGPGLRLGWMLGRPSGERLLSTTAEVSTLFAIIEKLSTSYASVEWQLWKKAPTGQKKDRELVTSHAALDLWHQPNKHMTGREFRETSAQHMELTGETPWIVPKIGRLPLELWPVRPDKLEPIPDAETFLDGYWYSGGGEQVRLGNDDVIRQKMPNPLDPYRGLGPVQALLTNLDAVRYSAEWNRAFFENSAEPGGIIEVSRDLDDDEFEQFRRRWAEQHRGSSNAHRVAMLETGQKWVDRTYTNRDMQFAELNGLGREVIREAYGFPKSMLGAVEDVNRANAEAGELVFGRWLTVPRLDRTRDVLNYRLLPMYYPRGTPVPVEFDYVSPVPEDRAADNEALLAQANAFSILKLAGVDPDWAAGHVGMPPITMAPTPEPAPAEPPAGGGAPSNQARPVAESRPGADWDPGEHPRDPDGKFRRRIGVPGWMGEPEEFKPASQPSAGELADAYRNQVQPTSGDIEVADAYQGPGLYKKINSRLRNGEELAGRPAEVAQGLDRLMDRYRTTEALRVYRGRRSIRGDEDVPGAVIEDLAYPSTTLSPDIADEFTNDKDTGVVWDITIPAGLNAMVMNGLVDDPEFSREEEVLLPRGTRFLILGKEEKDGKPWIHAIALPPNPTPPEPASPGTTTTNSRTRPGTTPPAPRPPASSSSRGSTPGEPGARSTDPTTPDESSTAAGWDPAKHPRDPDGKFRRGARTSLSEWDTADVKRLADMTTSLDRDERLGEIWRLQGFDGLPTVVSRAELDALPDDHVRLYRGVSTAAFAEQFRTGDAFPGLGVSGNGTYTAVLEGTADSYAGLRSGQNDGDGGAVLRMALSPQARVVVAEELTEMFNDVDGFPELDDPDVGFAFADMGAFAAALGYDAILVGADRVDQFYIVQNRTALIVEEAEGGT